MKYIVTPCTDALGYDKPIRADEQPETWPDHHADN
jgi:hypothetical protein